LRPTTTLWTFRFAIKNDLAETFSLFLYSADTDKYTYYADIPSSKTLFMIAYVPYGQWILADERITKYYSFYLGKLPFYTSGLTLNTSSFKFELLGK